MKTTTAFAILSFVLVVSTASATPLTTNYDLTDLGGGTYQYDFTLTLDNNDGSWSLGQEWDWIIFGDRRAL